MSRVIRSILAVIVGFVAASVVMMIVETANGRLLYPELGKRAQGVTDRQEIRAIMASAPVGALVVVLIGWALGSVAGGFLAALIGRKTPEGHALVLGALLTLAGVVNNLMLPPPSWFWIATFAVFLPATYAGARLVPQRAPAGATSSG
jgi:MFS family permease